MHQKEMTALAPLRWVVEYHYNKFEVLECGHTWRPAHGVIKRNAKKRRCKECPAKHT
mgnify:CR=1 FL=1|jgi:hypothetical protein